MNLIIKFKKKENMQSKIFDVSPSQNQFKQSSTAMLAITFTLFFAYSIVKTLANFKSNFGNDVI